MNGIKPMLEPVQNLSLNDRVVRGTIGAVLLSVAWVMLLMGEIGSWTIYSILVSTYPLMTAMLGWDPFYAMVHKKTCGVSDRNRCGTFPYQVDAALGHHPVADRDAAEYDHSLAASHHDPRLYKTHNKAA